MRLALGLTTLALIGGCQLLAGLDAYENTGTPAGGGRATSMATTGGAGVFLLEMAP